ncbi:MAG: ABC transporter permease, partial [Planctomycetes bacterium]|nr:ABC transporter permease [Planctomycetota bacterium]
MRNTLLVAGREYAENAKTKGFWIGIFLFPLILTISLTVPKWLEKATPTRHFVLVDQSGQFDEIIRRGIDDLHTWDVVKAYTQYATEHSKMAKEAKSLDAENTPSIDFGNNPMEAKLEELRQATPAEISDQLGEGGLEVMKERMQPYLADDAPEFSPPRRRFQSVSLPSDLDPKSDLETLAEGLRPYLRGDEKITVDGEPAELFAAILIPENIADVIIRPGMAMLTTVDRAGVQFWCTNLADNDLKEEVQEVVNKEIRRREFIAKDLDAATIAQIQKTRLPFASLNPKKEKGKEEVSLADQIRQWAPVAFVYLLWVGIFTIAQMLLNNTIEEKSNRIIEVLLSSVTARELMLGKLIGIAGVGLTMISAWIASLVAVLGFKAGPESKIAKEIFEVLQTSGLLPKFALYFILGYLIYAGIFLAIGSVCNTLKDAQNLMGPVMLIMIIPLMTMMFIPRDPHGTLATVMSWIPIYTPFVMMNRAAADPPLFDLIGTCVLLVVSAIVVLWLTGKIFRTGILRTGQPPKLFEMLRWV